VWIPNATILANIGDNVVVAAMSLVNKNIPSGCLAGGIPVRIIKENCYPLKEGTNDRLQKIINNFIYDEYLHIIPKDTIDCLDGNRVFINGTLFDFENKRIDGRVTEWTEKFKDYLRRWGVRFRYYPDEKLGVYKSW
jgi:hypothetical protein